MQVRRFLLALATAVLFASLTAMADAPKESYDYWVDVWTDGGKVYCVAELYYIDGTEPRYLSISAILTNPNQVNHHFGALGYRSPQDGIVAQNEHDADVSGTWTCQAEYGVDWNVTATRSDSVTVY